MPAFVYKWTHIPTLKWYVGSRTRKGCHPDDGYICSSTIVKPMIESRPQDWRREIIAVGSFTEMKQLERDILMITNAMNDPRSFNMSNAAGGMRSHTPWNKGKTGLQTPWNKGYFGEQHHRFGKKLSYKKSWTRSEQGEQMIERLKESNKLRNTEKLVCPYCQQAGEGPAMYRWHFANCRQEGGK